MDRVAKKKEDNKDKFRYKVFVDFFLGEVELRENQGKSFNPTKGAVERYKKLLVRIAHNVWEKAGELQVNPVNLSFLFLNRSYPMFIGASTPIPKMNFLWEEFLIKLSHEGHILILLNYDENKRRIVCEYVREIKESSQSNAFLTFVKRHGKGFKVQLPEHRYERSMMFETMLLMLKQIEDAGLSYYLNSHAIEILKAHAYYLKKWGDPIKLSLGCFIGENALHRLRGYQTFAGEPDLPGGKIDSKLLEYEF